MLLQAIGEGAQGRTFEAVDKREGRVVAIKRFDVRGATSWKDVELAEREARVLQSLSHPKLPAYIDHFEEDGALYLVMEKVEGESLAAFRKRGAVMGDEQVFRLLRDASDVLDYLHGRVPPVIHRDLKPGNVILRPDGSFAFVDFGAVRDKLRPRGGSTVVGTFGYMAPEQLQGRALPASDVYAIGATALTLLTDSEPEDLPHRGLSIDVRQAIRSARSGSRGDAKTRSAGTPNPPIADVLARMLDPDPDRRASRIAPLLSEARRPTYHDSWDPKYAVKEARRAARRARHAARRIAHEARRNAYRQASRRRHPLPWPVRLVLAIVFTVGMIAVRLATRVIVPLVLLVLSRFVARRPLTNAARAVSHAGETAVSGMRTSRRWFLRGGVSRQGEELPDSEIREDAAPRAGETGDRDGPIGQDGQVGRGRGVGLRVAPGNTADTETGSEPIEERELDELDEEWDSADEWARRRSGR